MCGARLHPVSCIDKPYIEATHRLYTPQSGLLSRSKVSPNERNSWTTGLRICRRPVDGQAKGRDLPQVYANLSDGLVPWPSKYRSQQLVCTYRS